MYRNRTGIPAFMKMTAGIFFCIAIIFFTAEHGIRAGAENIDARLEESLDEAVNSYNTPQRTFNTALFNTNRTALEEVLENEDRITRAADKYYVDKAMIQAIIFQETRFYGLDDVAGDFLTENSYSYEEQMEKYMKWDRARQAGFVPPPEAFAGYRLDCSTSLGQITARTAIKATNWYNRQHGINERLYSCSSWRDLRLFWNRLQDDDYNIDMIARILAYERARMKKAGKQPSVQDIMARYNGTGSHAQEYGRVTLRYYNAFSEYNRNREQGKNGIV
jgi:hypothetical protein